MVAGGGGGREEYTGKQPATVAIYSIVAPTSPPPDILQGFRITYSVCKIGEKSCIMLAWIRQTAKCSPFPPIENIVHTCSYPDLCTRVMYISLWVLLWLSHVHMPFARGIPYTNTNNNDKVRAMQELLLYVYKFWLHLIFGVFAFILCFIPTSNSIHFAGVFCSLHRSKSFLFVAESILCTSLICPLFRYE